MDKRTYSVFASQVVNGVAQFHLSKHSYGFELANRKGVANFVILKNETEVSPKELMEFALKNESVMNQPEVVKVVSAKIAKIDAEATRIANKGTVKRGRPAKVKTPAPEQTLEDQLSALVADIIPETV